MLRLDDTDTEAVPLLATEAVETNATISPDGRYIAYEFGETGPGNSEIYVRPFPDVDAAGPWQVSIGGGSYPRWSRDGIELFYLAPGSADGRGLMSVAVETDGAFRAGTPTEVFQGLYATPNLGRQAYDVSLDGQRFQMIRPALANPPSERRIVIVQNWTEELRQRVPVE